MTAEFPLRVLLVEDDIDVAASLGDFLAARGLRVDFAYTAAQARLRVQGEAYDVFILDVNLPDGDGVALCREFKERWVLRQPALMLTARGELGDKLRGFEAGAIDYVVKPFAPEELLARLRAIASHVPGGGGACLRIDDYCLDLQGRTLSRGELRLSLTASAYVLLRSLMSAHPGSVSREALCALLWEDEPPDSDPLRAHILQMRRQFEALFGSPLIATLRGVGYRFEGDGCANAV